MAAPSIRVWGGVVEVADELVVVVGGSGGGGGDGVAYICMRFQRVC